MTKQAGCLYEVQAFCGLRGWPQGLIKKLFYNLYETDVVFEDAYGVWREDVNDITPGKDKALFQASAAAAAQPRECAARSCPLTCRRHLKLLDVTCAAVWRRAVRRSTNFFSGLMRLPRRARTTRRALVATRGREGSGAAVRSRGCRLRVRWRLLRESSPPPRRPSVAPPPLLLPRNQAPLTATPPRASHLFISPPAARCRRHSGGGAHASSSSSPTQCSDY